MPSISSILNFDHIPTTTDMVAAGYYNFTWNGYYSSHTFSVYDPTVSKLIKNADGSIQVALNYGNGYLQGGYLAINFPWGATTTKRVVGYKVTYLSKSSNNLAHAQYNGASFINETAFTVGVEYRVEYVFDRVANTISIYLNDALYTTVPGASYAALSTLWFGSSVSRYTGSGNSVFKMREFYMAQDFGDGTYRGRLGDWSVLPITFSNAQAPGWTASDGTTDLTNILTTVRTTNTPNAINNGVLTPASLDMACPGLTPNRRIVAAAFMASSQLTGTGGNIRLDISNNGTLTKGRTINPGSGFIYNRVSPMTPAATPSNTLETDGQGRPFTADVFNGGKLLVQPTTV